MVENRVDKRKAAVLGCFICLLLAPISVRAATLDEVVFLNRIQEYETIAATTLVTQEGKRIPIPTGTRLNVAGFTRDQAFVISRTDRPNGFVPKEDIASRSGPAGAREGTIKEQTLE